MLFRSHRVAVRTGLRVAKHVLDALLHLGRHRMLEALGLFVGLPPFEPEHLDEEALRKTMATHDRVGVTLARLGQMHFFTVIQRDEPVALESMDHLRNGWCRESEELREARRNDVPVLVRERVDRLEILLDGRRSGNC